MPSVRTRIDLPVSLPIIIDFEWCPFDTRLGKDLSYGWISRGPQAPAIRSISLAPEAFDEIQSQIRTQLADPLHPEVVRIMSELSGPS